MPDPTLPDIARQQLEQDYPGVPIIVSSHPDPETTTNRALLQQAFRHYGRVDHVILAVPNPKAVTFKVMAVHWDAPEPKGVVA